MLQFWDHNLGEEKWETKAKIIFARLCTQSISKCWIGCGQSVTQWVILTDFTLSRALFNFHNFHFLSLNPDPEYFVVVHQNYCFFLFVGWDQSSLNLNCCVGSQGLNPPAVQRCKFPPPWHSTHPLLCTIHLPASALIAAHGGTVEVHLVEVGDVQNMIGWLITIVHSAVCLITTTHSTIRLHSAQSSKFP